MAEPLAVAFVEIEPIAPQFRAKTEAQVKSALAGSTAATNATKAATAAQKDLAAAEYVSSRASVAKAEAEAAAAAATATHARAARHAATEITAEAAAMAGARGAALGMNAPMLAAAVAAGVLFKSLDEADEFNESMHTIEVSTGATADEMERVSETSIALGRDLGIPLTTANDAAEAISFLTRSGFDLVESQQAARGALLLTAAAGDGLETSVRELDRILDAFNLTASDSERVADAIAIGMNFTQGSATEFAGALQTVAPAADLMGLSLEETNTLVLQLAESGLSAGQAAGSLRQALLRLATATGPQGKQIRDALGSIGLEVRDLITASGDLRPDAFVRLADSLKNVGEEQRKAILIQIFTRRAALGVLRIIDQQAEGYERMSEAANENGVALERGEARTRSFKGSLSEAKDEASDFSRVIGNQFLPSATAFVQIVGTGFQVVNDTIFLVSRFADAVGDLKDEFVDAIPGGKQLEGVVKGLAENVLNPIGAMERRIGFLGDVFHSTVGRWRDDAAEGSKIFEDLASSVEDSLGGLADAIAKAGESADKETFTAGGQTLQTQLAVAEAAGNTDEQLRLLRIIRSRAQQRLSRDQTRTDLTGAQQNQKIQKDAADIQAADAKIQSILDERAGAAKDAADAAKTRADEIEKAASERDKNFLRAMNRRIEDREGAVRAAADTEGFIQDDIRSNIRLRNALTQAIDQTRARIREARAAGRETAALQDELDDLRSKRNAVRRTLAQIRADAQAEQDATRVESAQLDLQILETRIGDDPTPAQNRKLVAAHQKVIAALKRAQSLTGRRTIEWKRLQAEIEQEKAAIRALQKSTTGSDASSLQALQRAEFTFLQTTHGFASNLFGNLIPGSATSGLVGGTATATGRPTAANLAVPGGAGRPVSGPTNRPVSAGQGNTQIQLLREIRNILKSEHGRGDHPEVHHARKKGAAVGDFSYQGTHGM